MTFSGRLYDKLVRSYWEASKSGDIVRMYETYWQFRDDWKVVHEFMEKEKESIELDFRKNFPAKGGE